MKTKDSRVMKAKIELRAAECEGLASDVCWVKTDRLKKGHNQMPLNGYIIELTGNIGVSVYQTLSKKKEEWDKKMGLM